MSEAKETANAITNDILASRYDRLTQFRSPYLDRARQCSLLTLPQVFPEAGANGTTDFYRPYQSIGARGVNNLANKLLLSLLPPNTPFFKMSVDDQTVAELASEEDRATVEERLNEIERTIQTRIETTNYRAPFITALKQLLVGGNVLLLFRKNGTVRVIRLDNYVVRRNAEGKVLEIIIREDVRYEDLDDDLKKLLAESELPSSNKESNTKELAVYTTYVMSKGRYKTYQTINGIKIPGSNGSYPEEKAPFIALRWSHEDNEDYGRSYVEEYIGDLQTAEGLSKAIVEASSAAAKVVVMVNPNGLTNDNDVSEAENLDVISGRDEDVAMLQLNKQADMVVAKDVLNDILQRVSYAFLMNTAIQRDAERVTAEEIREMVKELEDALGGTYALFSQEFQLPFVRILTSQLVKEKKIPDLSSLKKDGISIEPKITTGVEAIGRGHDLNKLLTFMREFVAPIGEPAFQMINLPDFLKRGGVSLGIDMDGLVKNPQQMQQEAEQAAAERQQQLTEQTIAEAAKTAAGPMAKAVTEAPVE